MILADSHLHSYFSADSEASMESVAEKAIELGLESICFTDHMDLDFPTHYGIDFTFSLPLYMEKLEEIDKKYGRQIQIRRGIEIGLMPHLKGSYDELLNGYDFDFIIGSSHVVSNMDPYSPDYWEKYSEEEGYRAYFQSIIDNVDIFDNFDTYGHIDYIVRYGPEKNKNYTYSKYSDLLDKILLALIEKDKCLEVNTSGLKYGLGQPHPHSDVLRRYYELGGEKITVGSDAHKPEHLAYGFKEAEEILTQIGFQYYAVFENRKPRMKKLR